MSEQDDIDNPFAETGPVSHDEAQEILSRLLASHFNKSDKEHTRISIPANVRRDDDLRMGSYIYQQRRAEADVAALLAAAKMWVNYFDKLNAHLEPDDPLRKATTAYHHDRVEVTRAAIARVEAAEKTEAR